MERVGRVRFDWREGLALVCALGRGACESDPQAQSLPVRGLGYLAACRQAGGAAGLDKLTRHARERLLRGELQAIRGALARLGDLGLVVWDFPEEHDELGYRLTELGWETALCFGRRVARNRAAAQQPARAGTGQMAVATGA